MLSRERLSTATAWGLDTAISPKLTIPSKTLQVALQQLRTKRAKLNRQTAALERAVDGTEGGAATRSSARTAGTFARLAGFESIRPEVHIS